MSQMPRPHAVFYLQGQVNLCSLLPKVTGQSRETIADGTNVQDMCVDGASTELGSSNYG